MTTDLIDLSLALLITLGLLAGLLMSVPWWPIWFPSPV